MYLNNIADATGQQPRLTGIPDEPPSSEARRNYRRMREFNAKKASNVQDGQVVSRGCRKKPSPMFIEKERRRSGFEKRKARRLSGKPEPIAVNSEQQKGVKTTPVSNELMWDDEIYGETKVGQQQYVPSLEFSMLVDICKESYLNPENTEAHQKRHTLLAQLQRKAGQVLTRTSAVNIALNKNNEEYPTIPLKIQDAQEPETLIDCDIPIIDTVTPTKDEVNVTLPNREGKEDQNSQELEIKNSNLTTTTEDYNSSMIARDLLPLRDLQLRAVSSISDHARPEQLQLTRTRKCRNSSFTTKPTIARRLFDYPLSDVLIPDEFIELPCNSKTINKTSESEQAFTMHQNIISDRLSLKESPSAQRIGKEAPYTSMLNYPTRKGTGIHEEEARIMRQYSYVPYGEAVIREWSKTPNARDDISDHVPSSAQLLLKRLHHAEDSGGPEETQKYDVVKRPSID